MLHCKNLFCRQVRKPASLPCWLVILFMLTVVRLAHGNCPYETSGWTNRKLDPDFEKDKQNILVMQTMFPSTPTESQSTRAFNQKEEKKFVDGEIKLFLPATDKQLKQPDCTYTTLEVTGGSIPNSDKVIALKANSGAIRFNLLNDHLPDWNSGGLKYLNVQDTGSLLQE